MKPVPARRADHVWILAHRGFHRSERQNSLAAFRAARRTGAHGIELDVRRTKDRVLVIHHDPHRRIRGFRKPLAQMTKRQLPRWVPTFEAMWKQTAAYPGFLVNVEIKEAQATRPTLRAMRHGGPDLVAVSSFQLPICKEVAATSKVPVGWILERPTVRHVARAKRAGCKFLVFHRRGLRPELVRAARRAGLRVWIWGINTPKAGQKAAAMGFHAIITDRPDLLVPLNLRRGALPRTSRRTGRRGSSAPRVRAKRGTSARR